MACRTFRFSRLFPDQTWVRFAPREPSKEGAVTRGALLFFALIEGAMRDLFSLDRHLTDAERSLARTTRAFVDHTFRPLVNDAWERGYFPRELPKAIGALGLIGCNLQGYGCADLGDVAYGVACRELERGDSGLRSFVSVQSSLVLWPIHTYGSDEQKNRWIPGLQSGELVGCFGLTEPDAGSNPSAMTTAAERIDGGWILRGEKRWLTNGTIADVGLIWAKAEGTVRGFLVPLADANIERRTLGPKLSLRASESAAITFHDVRLNDDALLPGVKGMKGPLSCLTQARYGIGWGVLGAAEECLDIATEYTTKRCQFDGKPLASHQLVQAKLAEMWTSLTASQMFALELGRHKSAGTLEPAQVSMVKRHNVHAALQTARTARELLGGNGILLEYRVMRHAANLETVHTYEGTHDVHTLVLGQEATGIAAYS